MARDTAIGMEFLERHGWVHCDLGKVTCEFVWHNWTGDSLTFSMAYCSGPKLAAAQPPGCENFRLWACSETGGRSDFREALFLFCCGIVSDGI